MKSIKTRILIIAIITLLPVLYSACKKDGNKSKKANGMVLNLGNPAADGCGWVIRVDHVDYTPINLDTTFQQDSLQVKVTYDLLQSRFQCGFAANIGFSEIKIKSISEQ
jgi:hypothetical protein